MELLFFLFNHFLSFLVINVEFDNHSVKNVCVKYVQYLFSPLKEQTTEGTPQRFDRERPLKA